MDIQDNDGQKKVVRINLIVLVKLSVLNLLGTRFSCKKLQSKDFKNVLVFVCNMIAGMLADLLARISIRNLLSNIYKSHKNSDLYLMHKMLTGVTYNTIYKHTHIVYWLPCSVDSVENLWKIVENLKYKADF